MSQTILYTLVGWYFLSLIILIAVFPNYANRVAKYGASFLGKIFDGAIAILEGATFFIPAVLVILTVMPFFWVQGLCMSDEKIKQKLEGYQ